MQKTNTTSVSLQRRRKGAAMIMAIIALIICTSISLSMFKTTMLRQQHFVNRQWKLQTELIADSALERAYHQLTNDPKYTGETWTVSVNEERGSAMIQVIDSQQDRYQVKVVARFPSDVVTRAQVTIETEIERKNQ